MARKKKTPPDGPNKGYLISFGDTMTALLAFFIVLNSLAEEQTGANLHAGTGSFVRALNGLGMPSVFSTERSTNATQLKEASPLYPVEDVDGKKDGLGIHGPDEENGGRVIDREKEEYLRFINELTYRYQSQGSFKTKAQVAFDIFEHLEGVSPVLPQGAREILAEILPRLRHANIRLQVVVWAATPSSTAWQRSARQAAAIRGQIVKMARLSPADKKRVTSMSKTWNFSDEKRPTATFVLIKSDPH